MFRCCVVDVENTFVRDARGKDDPSPFNPLNKLVMVGTLHWYYGLEASDTVSVTTFYHQEADKITDPKYQRSPHEWAMGEADLLIGHNIKHDLNWLGEVGYKIDKPVFDTMLAEYVALRSRKLPLDLSSVGQRTVGETKEDEVKKMMDEGISPEKIPHELLRKYLIQDLLLTKSVFLHQVEKLDIDYLVRRF